MKFKITAFRMISLGGLVATIRHIIDALNISPDLATSQDLTDHSNAADPHTVYQKESEKDQANGYAGLNASSIVPIARLGSGVPDGTKFLRDDNTLATPPGGGGGVSDGDKGDITVSAGGTVWTIDSNTVTYGKMQDVSATDKLLGRATAGAGDVEEITLTAAGRALIDDASAADQRTTLGAVGTTRSIATTAPLTGGGDLSADRTLGVSAATTAALGVVELATDGETAANVVVQGADSRLSNARTPIAHETTHRAAGIDPLSVLNLAGFPGGTTDFLRADATFAAPPSGGVSDGDKGDIVVSGSGANWMLDSAVVTAAAKTVLDDATTAAMLATLGGAAIGVFKSIQVLTAGSGATYTTPAGVKAIRIHVIGGGGAGGSSAGAASSSGWAGGGGSGAYTLAMINNPAATYLYTIGAGGTPGAAGNTTGGAGTPTQFNGAAITANGGNGGSGSGAAAGTALTVLGGAGGPSGAGGSVARSGTPGGPGCRWSATIGVSGNGASSTLGGGVLGRITAGTGNAAVANTGAGGGGAGSTSTNAQGGAGGSGVIIVEEYA